MAQDAPQDSAGPSSPPPPLPDGWLAQWEGVSRKWYFVQRATGKSQWEIPTDPVILTPSTTPGSIGAGPTQAPHMVSPAVSPVEGMNYAANRGIFSHSTERAGLSGLLGSHGGGSGLTQLADRMFNKISKEFMPGKTGANAYQQFPPGHPNHPASQMYGQGGRPPQFQSAANPYGYASIGQTGSYTGDVPQYHPQGQGQGQPMSPGGFHQPQGVHPQYSHHQYQNQPAMTPQFSPVSPASQHSWQGHQQPPPAYPPGYQVSEVQGGSHTSVSPVGQPEWQLPTIPHATKPTVNHIQQDPNHPAPNAGQPQFHNPPVSHQQHPQQPNQFAGNPYQQGHPIYEAPGDIQQMSRPQTQGHPDPSQQQMANMHIQNPQHGSQHSTPFTPGNGGIPAPPAVAPNFPHNSSVTSLNGPNINPQQGNLSHQASLTSLSSNHPPPNRPTNANSFIAELPDNQVGISQAPNHPTSQPGNLPHMNQPPPNGLVNELPGSEPIRHTPTDPQFVSGPWTLPPPPPQNRYNNSSGFSR